MSRVLLVNPPFYRLLGSHYNANSLGIAYVAAVLNRHGHDAWLYNADFVNANTYANLQKLFDGFHDYTRYFKDEDNEIWEEVVQRIIDFAPDWVGYTSYTANLKAIDIISRKLDGRLSGVRQVIGGVHATLDCSVLMKLPAIDFAVRREGEYAMLGLVEGQDPSTIQGVALRGPSGLASNGDAEVIRDIDGLPFPERDKFWGLTDEEKMAVDVSYICTIRGCPYRCNYCASPFHWKRDKTQYRSPESVIGEMRHLKDNYWRVKKRYDFSASANTKAKGELIIEDNSLVYFVDDVFTVKKERVKQILHSIIEQNLQMPWKCEARTDHLTPEICELMKAAGCVRVKLGFESGSEQMLKKIQKDETKDDMRKGAQMLKNAGVPFTAYFMAGFPGETDVDLKETIEFAREIDADYYSLSVLAPYYGTKLFADLASQGHELEKEPWEYFFHQTGKLMVNSTISRDVLTEFLALNELNRGRDRTGAIGYV